MMKQAMRKMLAVLLCLFMLTAVLPAQLVLASGTEALATEPGPAEETSDEAVPEEKAPEESPVEETVPEADALIPSGAGLAETEAGLDETATGVDDVPLTEENPTDVPLDEPVFTDEAALVATLMAVEATSAPGEEIPGASFQVATGQATPSVWGGYGFEHYGNEIGVEDTFRLEFDGGVLTNDGAYPYWNIGYGSNNVFLVPAGTELDGDVLRAAGIPLDCWLVDDRAIAGAFLPQPSLLYPYGEYCVVFYNPQWEYYVVSQPIHFSEGHVNNHQPQVIESLADIYRVSQDGYTDPVQFGEIKVGQRYLDLGGVAEVYFHENYPHMGDYMELFLVQADVPLEAGLLRQNAIYVSAGWNSTGSHDQHVGGIQLSDADLNAGDYRFVVVTHGSGYDGTLVVSQPVSIGGEETPPSQTGDVFDRGDYSFEVTDYDRREAMLLGFRENLIYDEWKNFSIPATIEVGGDIYRVVAIAERAFQYSEAFEDLVIPAGIRTIGDYAFFNSTSALKSVYISETVSDIGVGVFNSCYNLSSITVHEDNPRYVARNDILFTRDGTQLLCYPAAKPGNSYTVPSTVEVLPFHAFSGNGNLKTIVLPEGLQSLYGQALSCKNLETVNIPASVVNLGYEPFLGAESLCNLTVAEGNPYYKSVDGVLFSKDGTVLIAYPGGLPTAHYAVPEGTLVIGPGAFWRTIYDHGNLREVTLPESLTSIGTYAFRLNHKLERINIPAGVNDIGTQPLLQCESLVAVTCDSAVPPGLRNSAYYSFTGIPSSTVLYIPQGAREAYETAGWLDYFTQVEYLETEPEVLAAISVSQPPLKTSYWVGEALDLSGLVVTATYEDGSSAEVEAYTTSPAAGDLLDENTTALIISYTENEITRTAELPLTVAVPAPVAEAQYKGNTYQIYDLSMTWFEAKAFCEEQGGHLATVTSAEEQAVIEGLVAQGGKLNYWLGASKEGSTWDWVTGEAFSYNNWGAGQPDGHAGEQYLHILAQNSPYSRLYRFQWNDIRYDGVYPREEDFYSTEKFGFLCEFDKEEPQLTGLSLTLPHKTEYLVGDALDLEGLVVTAHYSDGSALVADGYSTNPANGALLAAVNTEVTVSYEGLSQSFAIIVREVTALSVGISNTTIVETLAAYLNITVEAQGVEDMELTAWLKVGEELLYPTEISRGAGRMFVAAAPVAGQYEVVVAASDGSARGSSPVEVTAYSTDIWTLNAYADEDGYVVLLFNEQVAAKDGKFDREVSLNGKAVNCVLGGDGKSLVTDVRYDDLPTGANTFKATGVKYPRLFPSYSFTFTVQVNR